MDLVQHIYIPYWSVALLNKVHEADTSSVRDLLMAGVAGDDLAPDVKEWLGEKDTSVEAAETGPAKPGAHASAPLPLENAVTAIPEIVDTARADAAAGGHGQPASRGSSTASLPE